jgi:hypothetical protein
MGLPPGGRLKGSLGQGLRFAIINGSRPMPKIRGKAAFVTPERARVREKSSVCKAFEHDPERWKTGFPSRQGGFLFCGNDAAKDHTTILSRFAARVIPV